MQLYHTNENSKITYILVCRLWGRPTVNTLNKNGVKNPTLELRLSKSVIGALALFTCTCLMVADSCSLLTTLIHFVVSGQYNQLVHHDDDLFVRSF